MTWRSLMSAAAIIEAALLLVTGVSLGDSETLAFGVAVAATTAWFIWRSSRVPVLIRSLVFLDVFFFMATATIANLTTHESLGAVALPLTLAVVSGTGLIASAGYLIRGVDPGATQRVPALVVIAALGLSAGVVTVTVAGGGASQQAQGADLKLSAHSAKFSTTTLSASSGTVAISPPTTTSSGIPSRSTSSASTCGSRSRATAGSHSQRPRGLTRSTARSPVTPASA
jgi:hypothetical protein